MEDEVGYGKPPKSGQFSADNQPQERRSRAGVPNRSTVARRILSAQYNLTDQQLAELKEQFPEIDQVVTAEDYLTIKQLMKAIKTGDTNAYKALMDSAYGAPKQEIEATVDTNVTIFQLPDNGRQQ